MEYLIIISALILAAIALVGAVMPVLPGTPVSYIALLMLLLCDGYDVSVAKLVVTGLFALVVTVIDYIAPIWLTKKKGGSKEGTWGATIGLVLGFFVPPIGVIVGPFIGAFIGEKYAGVPSDKAFGIACMSFMAFMLTTGIKLIYGIAVLVMICIDAWKILF